MAADMLTNHLVRDLDDHDLSVLHTRNTQNGLVGVACVNPLIQANRLREVGLSGGHFGMLSVDVVMGGGGGGVVMGVSILVHVHATVFIIV